jgi:hypothetical protein
MMTEYSTTLHASLLPSALVNVPVGPYHLSVLVIAAILELSLIRELTRDSQFSLAVLAITIPAALVARILSFRIGAVEVNTKSMLN